MPASSADHWQKHYYRGTDVNGEELIGDHRAKLRLKSFNRSAAPYIPVAPADDKDIPSGADWQDQRAGTEAIPNEIEARQIALTKREWLLESLENQRDLAPKLVGIERRADLSSEAFLEQYYVRKLVQLCPKPARRLRPILTKIEPERGQVWGTRISTRQSPDVGGTRPPHSSSPGERIWPCP